MLVLVALAVDEVVMFLIPETPCKACSKGMAMPSSFSLADPVSLLTEIATRLGVKLGKASLFKDPIFRTPKLITKISNRLAATGLLANHGIMPLG